MRKFYRNNRMLRESNGGNWYIITLINKDDLRNSINSNKKYVNATKQLIYADDEESAIELAATQASYDNEFDHWSDEFILHSIKRSSRDDYEYGKKRTLYTDVYISKSIMDQIDDDNDDSEYDEYGLEKIDSYSIPNTDYDEDVYYGYNENFNTSSMLKHTLNETSYGAPPQKYTSNGSLAFYKDSDKRDIIEMSEFAFAIARSIIKNSNIKSYKHELYSEILEDILYDDIFAIAMHGAKLPDLSDTDKLEKDMGQTQYLVGHIIDNYK